MEVTTRSETKFILFPLFDIVNDKEAEKVRQVETNLNNLSKAVVSLYERGIPIEIIKTSLDNTINDLEKEKNKEKKLQKYGK